MKRDKIILVNPLGTSIDRQEYYKQKGSFTLSMGLVVIGTVLKRHGFEVKIIDMAYDQNYRDLIINEVNDRIAFVGCSVMTTQVPAALEISRLIKSLNSDIPVVWGGPHPTLFYDQTASHSDVDIAVVNECTKIIPQLAKTLALRESLEGIDGVAFKNGEGVTFSPNKEIDDLEEIGELDHTIYDSHRYIRNPLFSPPLERDKVVAYPLLTGLGCCYRCKFCINFILKRKYRFKKPETIIREIKKLSHEYGANAIWFMDEDFFINKKRAVDLFKLVEKEGLRFIWRTWVRIDHFKENYLDKETVKWLAGLGWAWSSMGAESGSSKTLAMIDKGITPEQTIKSAKFLHSIGPGHWSRYVFIIGLPGETLSDMAKTFALAAQIKLINPRTELTIAYFRPYPGSELSDLLLDAGNLKYPGTLQDWDKVFSKEGFLNEENLSWVSLKDQQKIKLLYFYFGMVKNYPDKKLSILRRLLNNLSFFRLKHNTLFFPFEQYLFNIWISLKPYLLKIKWIGDWYDKSWH